jgi:ribosomal protein S18 acetylase RimI-like enzyme
MSLHAEEVEVRRLSNDDLSIFRSLIEMFNKVFEENESAMGSRTSLQRLLENRNFIVLAAIAGNEVLGGLTAYELPMYYSDEPEIFLYDLAVQTEYQRMGIGKRLIQKLREYCLENGVKTFFVMAHEEDEHAVEFYHSTGGQGEKVVNFIYTSNPG